MWVNVISLQIFFSVEQLTLWVRCSTYNSNYACTMSDNRYRNGMKNNSLNVTWTLSGGN